MDKEAASNIDRLGHETLNVIAQADKFNAWMYETVQPFISGTVLEIGSGIGNMSDFLIRSAQKLYVSDFNETYLSLLRERFSKHTNLGGVFSIDLNDQRFDEKFASLFNLFDTIIALNVVEHIGNDELAISNCEKLLKKGGHLIILVPAYQVLYNRFDKELGHFRRYTRKKLKALMGKHLEIIHSQYFNFPGIFGWFLSGMIMRNRNIPSSQMGLFNKLVPLFKGIEKIVSGRAGLSVIVVGRK